MTKEILKDVEVLVEYDSIPYVGTAVSPSLGRGILYRTGLDGELDKSVFVPGLSIGEDLRSGLLSKELYKVSPDWSEVFPAERTGLSPDQLPEPGFIC